MNFKRMIAASAFVVLAGQAIAQPSDPPSNPPDWITATNQPCKLWNPNPVPNESVTWSGGCTDGYASGTGVLRWTLNGKLDVEFQGRYANGKRNGHGVMLTADGRRIEGDWLNDELIDPDSPAI